MRIKWDADAATLTIDDREYYNPAGIGSPDAAVEVPVSVLRNLPAKKVPRGVTIMAVRRVGGTTSEFYGSPANVVFVRHKDGSASVSISDVVSERVNDFETGVAERLVCNGQWRILVLGQWVDADDGCGRGRDRLSVDEPLGVGGVGGIEGELTVGDAFRRSAAVDDGGCHHCDSGVTVFMVVPLKESFAEPACIGQ